VDHILGPKQPAVTPQMWVQRAVVLPRYALSVFNVAGRHDFRVIEPVIELPTGTKAPLYGHHQLDLAHTLVNN
jgi:hypothetical protein